MQDSLEIYDNLVDILQNKDSINFDELKEILGDDYEINLEIAKSLGIPLKIEDNNISIKTSDSIFNNTFCIVDIETTGFSPQTNNIIEIGAIKYRNGKILDKFESYVFAKEIPEKITEITGIDSSMVANAPMIDKVLREFKIFLEDSIFLAHNAIFDFNFINAQLAQTKIPIMKNQVICTLALARKTIKAQKYGLEFLNGFLNINYPIRHRAYADCYIALRVFEEGLLNLPYDIKSVYDLIKFIKSSKVK